MVTVLALIGVVAVLFVAAVVATREGPVLADAPPDAADLELPERPLAPEDVQGLRFGLAARGYRMSEVDAALERLSAELADRDRRIALLEATVEGDGAPAGVAVHEATAADLPAAEPVVPAGPVSPAAPVAPAGPVAPAAPVQPSAPPGASPAPVPAPPVVPAAPPAVPPAPPAALPSAPPAPPAALPAEPAAPPEPPASAPAVAPPSSAEPVAPPQPPQQ